MNEKEAQVLFDLQEEWQRVFGEGMPWGFEIGEQDIPLLQRCVKNRSRVELERLVRERLKDGRVY